MAFLIHLSFPNSTVVFVVIVHDFIYYFFRCSFCFNGNTFVKSVIVIQAIATVVSTSNFLVLSNMFLGLFDGVFSIWDCLFTVNSGVSWGKILKMIALFSWILYISAKFHSSHLSLNLLLLLGFSLWSISVELATSCFCFCAHHVQTLISTANSSCYFKKFSILTSVDISLLW